MNYYEVMVASQQFHGSAALTYEAKEVLNPGSVVLIRLRQQLVPGIITTQVPKPTFKTKPVAKIIEDVTLPRELVSLISWLSGYYPAPLGQIVSLLLPASLKQVPRKKSEPTNASASASVSLPPLTKDQAAAVRAISDSSERMHLLHGITGSGKTRVYLELISRTVESRKTCIVLTPEIGLTPQLAHAIDTAFPGLVTVLHSDLTAAERRRRWLHIAKTTTPQIILGPRSALFAPAKTVGLIIVDEVHDDAYKQDQPPHYLVSRVAAKLAELHQAKVVLGSATPLIADYYTFETKGLPILRLSSKALQTTHTSQLEVISLADRSHFQKSQWLSDELIQRTTETLGSGSQSLIFLNRRGSARLVSCEVCGWQALCTRCDIPLTYHGDKHTVQCHTCGYSAGTPSVCKDCGSADLVFKSIGTKAIVTELEKLFPGAIVRRFDSDTHKDDRLEMNYEEIRSGGADIIVGTQMLAKGLDLPKLGLVGIVLADTGMYFPDYTAEERTFQLLCQVIGRVDRGHRDTRVVLQTYHPENLTIQQAVSEDYQGFYEAQLAQRQKFGFPPFRYLLKIKQERASSKAAEKAITDIRKMVVDLGLNLDISLPAPSFIEKAHGKYRWQLIVKAADRSLLLRIIKILPASAHYDIDPTNLL